METNHLIKLQRGLLAGLVAITVHTVLLKLAPLMTIEAESGGLLKLVILQVNPYLSVSVISFFHTTVFWIFFHYLTGFTMVVLYMYVLEPVLPGKILLKGSLFSLFPWLINGMIVLPLLGQGIFGYHKLPLSGMIYFFIANGMFALLFVYLQQRFNSNSNSVQ